MNMPLAILNRRRRGFTAFSPSALFALAEPGVWYDPSDVANLNWRVNLLTWTEQFDNAAWVKAQATISANAATAPDGTLTADKIVETAVTNAHGVYATFTYGAGLTYAATVYAKAAERSWVYIGADTAAAEAVFFDLSGSGAVGSAGTGYTGTITPVGDGWFRCQVVFAQATALPPNFFVIGASTGNGTTSYAGNTSNGILIWGAQLELGTVATTYQPITDVNTEVVQRFPYATLYQENTGATAVTTPGQTVGLMLDKSKQQSWFDVTGAVWTKTAGDGVVTVSGNTITITGATTTTLVTRTAGSIPFTSGQARMIIQADWVTATGVNVWLRGGPAAPVNGVQTLRTATLNNSTLERLDVATGSVTFTISSFQYWAGNHATQATLAARPTYSVEPVGGRRNLLTYSEQFDNAVWLKAGLNAFGSGSVVNTTATADPVGGSTAEYIQENSASGDHTAYVNGINLTAAPHTFTVYCKAAQRTWAYIRLAKVAGQGSYFNLSSGTVGTVEAGITAAITSVGNGWYRCSVTITTDTTAWYPTILMATGDNQGAYTGNGTSGIYIWGAQLEQSATATPYQRVTTQHDVTEAGVASVGYLYFDGASDNMVTSTITPGIDKVQIFAGVRKLTNVGVGTIVEFSPEVSLNSGSFIIRGPQADGANYFVGSRGSVANFRTLTTYTAPITNILAMVSDISAPLLQTKVDGVTVDTSTANQGTGNFLAYPLYLGSRGGTTFQFNGQLFGLITRFGPNLAADQITSTEQWLAPKTGVVLP